jgi:hypothetical protein
MSQVDPELVRRHLAQLLASDSLSKSETSRKLVSYLVERAIRNDAPKETDIALDVFGKDASFHGSDDSVVRVSVRTLRQKLTEYYAGPGRDDELHFEIPKGGYRLAFVPQTRPAVGPAVAAAATALVTSTTSPSTITAVPASVPVAGARTAWPRRALWLTSAAVALLAISLFANIYQWNDSRGAENPVVSRARDSAVWADMVASHRPLTMVLGDLFMYTQTDAATGHTIYVRDASINSSEELRALLASNPPFAAERGQRYVTMIQKSAAVGMAAILPIVTRPGRNIEVVVRDDFTGDGIRDKDIIYIGPLVRLGPLASYYQSRSRYRYSTEGSTITDVVTSKVYAPEGTLGGARLDYALASKFNGPAGNHIMIFTAGGRNAGLLQIVRTLTSPEGLAEFEKKLHARSSKVPDEFEALLTVTGFKTTDLAASIVDVNPLAAASMRTAKSLTPE